MTAKDHNKLLSIFMLVHGGLQVLGGLFVAVIYGGMGLGFLSKAHSEQERMMGTIFIVLACVITPLVFTFAGIFLTAGWKLFKEKSGGKTWGIVASAISLLGFPLGTALGVYGLWFLCGEQGKRFYESGGNMTNNYPPPPPHQWQ